MKLITYHGGREVVRKFDSARRKRAEYGTGFYFADDFELASQFGPVVSAYEVRLRRPLVVDQFKLKSTLARLSGGAAPGEMRLQGDWITSTAKALGYDGVVVELVTGGRYVVAFRAGQVRYVELGPAPEVPEGPPLRARLLARAKWEPAF